MTILNILPQYVNYFDLNQVWYDSNLEEKSGVV